MITSASARAEIRWHDHAMNNEVLDAFSEYQRAQSLAPTTIRNRESLLRGVAKSIGVPLLEATPHQLRRHLGRDTVTASTKRTERNALITFYRFAQVDGYRDDDPALKLPPVHVPKGEPRPFTGAQIAAMLNSGARQRTRLMIMLGYYQGFRVSQIARVRGSDFDRLTKTVRTVAKGSKERRLPVHPAIWDEVWGMPRGWWFPSPSGGDKPISGASVTDLITKAKKRAGITDPRLTPHSLRHSFGSGLVDQGVDIRVVQELMLHEDLSTTQIYTRVSAERKSAGLFALPPLPAHGYPPAKIVA